MMRSLCVFLAISTLVAPAFGQPFEAPVLVTYGAQSAATSNVNVATLTGSGVTIADFTFTANGQQLLLTAQTNPAENGLYQVNTAGAWYPTYPASAATSARPSVVLVSLGAQSRAVCFSLNWVGVGTSSTWSCTLAQSPYAKSAYLEASSDTIVTAGNFTDVLTLPFAKSLTPSVLLVRATLCGSSPTAGSLNLFQVYIDGVAQGTTAGQTVPATDSIQCGVTDLRVSGIATGSRSIALRLTAGTGDAKVRPTTVSGERASILVEEVRQ